MSQELKVYRGDDEDLCAYLYTKDLLPSDTRDPFIGGVEVTFESTDEKESPSEVQLKTYKYIAENLQKILSSIANTLYKEREEFQETFGTYTEESGFGFPHVNDALEILEHLSINNININYAHSDSDVKDDMTYFSFQGESVWGGDHGFGTVLFKNHVLDIGGWQVHSPSGIKDLNFKEVSIAEKYGTNALEIIVPPENPITINDEKTRKGHLELFDWLIGKKALYGYRSTQVNLNDEEKIQLIYSIRRLNLVGKELDSLPMEFKFLKNLNSLELRGNNFKSVPDSISHLSELSSLGLSLNSISELPLSFSNLKKIEHLDIAQNKFKSLPKVISHMTLIHTLEADNNLIEKIAPWIGDLKELESLYVSDNLITELPKELSNLAKLKYFVAMNNKFSKKQINEYTSKYKKLFDIGI